MGCGGFRIEEIGCPRGGGFGGEQMAQGGQGWSGATPATELRAARPLHSRTGTVGSDPCPSSSERAVTLPSQRLEVSHLDMGGGGVPERASLFAQGCGLGARVASALPS